MLTKKEPYLNYYKYQRHYYQVHRKKRLEYTKEYYYSHLEKIKQQHREWKRNNHDKINRDRRIREKNDIRYHLDSRLRTSIRFSLKGKKEGRHWEDLVGYTVEKLMQHLERQFDSKMNWKNYGSYWDIDHIEPKSLFKYGTAEDPEFKKCWALKNLQPLEHIANLRKFNHWKSNQ